MPRIDFKLWDRVYILKLICTAQMTYSSFIALVYLYLIILQSWTYWETERADVLDFKWGVIVVCVLEFGLGTLLAFAANMTGVRRRRRIIAWLMLETLLVPISICLLMQLYCRIVNSRLKFTTDPHYSRVSIAQVCFLIGQYLFIGYALDSLVYSETKPKMYDPSIRPESVYAPTDPQITTTESRHIRMSQSFPFQPSSSKRIERNDFSDEDTSSNSGKDEVPNEEPKSGNNGTGWTEDEEFGEDKDWMRDDVIWTIDEKNHEKTGLGNEEEIEGKEWKNDEDQEWTGNVQRQDEDIKE